MSNGKKLTPEETRLIVSMRAAGWSLTTIAEKLGIGISSVQRTLKRHPVRSGEALDEITKAARMELLSLFDEDTQIKAIYSEIIADQLSQIRLARTKSAESLEALNPTDSKSATQCMRAIAAHATAMKLHTDSIRSLLERPLDEDRIPELVIREMTTEDVKRLQQTHADEMAALGLAQDEAEECEA